MIFALIGISGSGKSTLAAQLAKEHSAIVVNRDKIREMVFGYSESEISNYYKRTDLNDCEKVVSTVADGIIKTALVNGTNVVIDNTHLKKTYINDILKKWNRFTDIKFIVVPCEPEVAVYRDSLRTRVVGKDIIMKQYQDFKNLTHSPDFEGILDNACTAEKIQTRTGLPECVIFDIDGTLADKGTRHAFDYDKAVNDTVRQTVFNSWKMHFDKGDHIIICTGREGVCEQLTKDWLAKHGILWDEFYIRNRNDFRPDWQVKEEMWREISTRYRIKLMYDDRDQVVEHARNLGFEVYQVAPGNF